MIRFAGILGDHARPEPIEMRGCTPVEAGRNGRLYIEDSKRISVQHSDTGCLLLAGRPRLAGDPDRSAHSIAGQLLSELDRNETGSLERLEGAFAVAWLGPDRALLASDSFNQIPLYFAATPRGFVFASHTRDLQALAPACKELNPDALYAYIYFHMIPAPLTIYQGVCKLKPRQITSFRDGEIRHRHRPFGEFTPADAPLPDDALGQLIPRLQEATRLEIRDDPESAGAFLSGGLDSSTLTGVLANLQERATPAFSIGFDQEGYDEMEYAETTARHFGCEHIKLYVTPEQVLDGIPLAAGQFNEPFGNSSAIPAFYCAQLAKAHQVNHLVAGDGGDEFFGGNTRYLDQETYHYFHRLPGPLQRILAGILGSKLLSSSEQSLIRKARNYVSRARMPLPDRTQVYNFLNQTPASQVFSPDLLDKANDGLPLAMLRGTFRDAEADNDLDRMLYLDWKFTLADNDLVKVSSMCELAGMEVSFPMLDDDLVRFSQTIPAREKIKARRLRHYFKEASKDFLHPKTITKSKHGFGLPFGHWMRDHEPLRIFAYDSLESLKTRGFFQPEFIDTAIRLHREGHASYHGEQVWILMMLEQWLQQHA